jgi:hypothetical protein
MKHVWIIFVLIASSAAMFAQDKPAENKAETSKPTQTAEASKNPVTDAVKEILPRQQKNLIAAVGAMPADKFGYSPTPAQQTFGHLVLHMATSNVELCSKAGNMPPPPLGPPVETDKNRMVVMLTKSFLFCEAALNRLDDSKLGGPVELWGGKRASVAFALIALTNDWADHYSAAAMYLRLNGVLPPTAQPKP